MKVKRGEIYLADLSDGTGSEQKKVRPVLIIQNNLGNKYSPTTIVACLSSKTVTKANIPTHYHLPEIDGLRYKSMVATVYKGNIIKNLIMDCQSYTKYRPNETTGGIFVSWRRKEELPTGA